MKKITSIIHNSQEYAALKGDTGNTGPVGPQGATSVYDSTTQNFLTTLETTTGQDQTKTMTQKAITDELVAIQKKLGEWKDLNAGNLPTVDCCMGTSDNSNWQWRTSGSTAIRKQKHSVIPVIPGEKYIVKVSTNDGATAGRYGWLTSSYAGPPLGGSLIPYVSGTVNNDISLNEEVYITAPASAAYLCLNRVSWGGLHTDWEIKKYEEKDINGELSDLHEELRESTKAYKAPQGYTTVTNIGINDDGSVSGGIEDRFRISYLQVKKGESYEISVESSELKWRRIALYANIPSDGDTPIEYYYNVQGESYNTSIETAHDGFLAVYNSVQTEDFMLEIAKVFGISEVGQGWLKGKTVAILGDSICTNGNTGTDSNVPEMVITSEDVGVELSAYLTYFDVNTNHLSLGGHTFTSNEIGTEVTFTPVAGDVGKVIGMPQNYNQNSVTTWWEIASKVLGFTPIPACWSGSSLSSHEKGTANRKTSWAWHPAQIRKCGIRVPGSMTRTAPDVIISVRGGNDMTHEPYTVLTDDLFKGPDFTIPEDDEIEAGVFGYKEAYAITIKKLREAYPFAHIVLCTFNVLKRVNSSHFPTNNGINSLPEYNNAVREIADYFGCGLIEFDKDGITFENCYPTYIDDSATTPTHPNDAGHRMMAKKAIADLKKMFDVI